MVISHARERRLIGRAKKGDGKAIEALIRSHQEPLYAFMLRMSGRPEVAEDIVQEAFVRVLRNLDRFDSRFRFSTWVFTIAKRLYVNAMQKHAPVFDSETVDLQQGGWRGPESASADAETADNTRSMLDLALASLSPQQREIVLLFHQQEWPITAIAEHLQMPEGTIKSHLHRARKRMKSFIQADAQLRDQAAEVWAR